jgi:hypothetical protein
MAREGRRDGPAETGLARREAAGAKREGAPAAKSAKYSVHLTLGHQITPVSTPLTCFYLVTAVRDQAPRLDHV